MGKYLSNAEFRAYAREGARTRYSKPLPAGAAHRLADSLEFRAAAARAFSFPEVGVARILRAHNAPHTCSRESRSTETSGAGTGESKTVPGDGITPPGRGESPRSEQGRAVLHAAAPAPDPRSSETEEGQR